MAADVFYRVDTHGHGVFKKDYSGGYPEYLMFNVPNDRWEPSVFAIDAFYEGDDTFPATEEEALHEIEAEKARYASRKDA